ncbi:MAG: hypothetical protein ACLUPL_09820 [Butyricimonas virosa]
MEIRTDSGGKYFFSLSYKGFTLNITTGYKFGGDAYNNTLADKVENINPWENVDRRAFTDRWKEPGDLKRFGIRKVKVITSGIQSVSLNGIICSRSEHRLTMN